MHLIVTISDKVGGGNLLEAGFDKFEITEAVGLTEISSDNALINVHPNPFTSNFNIHFDHSISANGMQLKIMDIAGRELLHQILFTQDAVINANKLNTAGIYLLQLSDESGYNQTIKLIKTK